MFHCGIEQRGEREHEDRVVCMAQSSIELDKFLRSGGNQLLLGRYTAWQGPAFLPGTVLEVERDNVYTFVPGEIGLRELGSAVSEDADVGHSITIWQGLQPPPNTRSFY